MDQSPARLPRPLDPAVPDGSHPWPFEWWDLYVLELFKKSGWVSVLLIDARP